MIQSKRINGIDIKYSVIDPMVDDVHTAFKFGSSIRDFGHAEKANVSLNFNYADTITGTPIGRLIVGGVEVVHDGPKTVARDELYMLPDRSVHIGKAPTNAIWAMQGSPRLLDGGNVVIDESIKRDQLGKDIWSGVNYRVAVGITDSKQMILVRTINKVTLHQLADIMLTLGCRDALNGDGGGSCYLWPYDSGWGRKLGAALIVKKGEEAVRTFKRFTLAEYIRYLKTFASKVKFSEVHVHHTWKPTQASWRASKNKESVMLGMYNAHLGRDFSDIAQHATIDPDGYIWDGRGLLMPPASAIDHNDSDNDLIHPFMFEMIGDFDIGQEKLEGAQLATVVGLVRAVMDLWKLNDSNVRFHREMQSGKSCPGTGITKDWFLAQLKPAAPTPDPTKVVATKPETIPAIQGHVNIVVNGKVMPQGYLIGGLTYVPIRTVSEALGATIGWDQETKTASLKGGK
jgi:hypothetical protein